MANINITGVNEYDDYLEAEFELTGLGGSNYAGDIELRRNRDVVDSYSFSGRGYSDTARGAVPLYFYGSAGTHSIVAELSLPDYDYDAMSYMIGEPFIDVKDVTVTPDVNYADVTFTLQNTGQLEDTFEVVIEADAINATGGGSTSQTEYLPAGGEITLATNFNFNLDHDQAFNFTVTTPDDSVRKQVTVPAPEDTSDGGTDGGDTGDGGTGDGGSDGGGVDDPTTDDPLGDIIGSINTTEAAIIGGSVLGGAFLLTRGDN